MLEWLIHIIPHAYWRNTSTYNIYHRVDIYRLVKHLYGFLFLLIFLVVQQLTTSEFPHSSLMKTSWSKSFKFPMSSISISSISSSTITTFCEGLHSSLKTWFALKVKLEKYKKLNIYKFVTLYFIELKFVIKINQIPGIWLVNWN